MPKQEQPEFKYFIIMNNASSKSKDDLVKAFNEGFIVATKNATTEAVHYLLVKENLDKAAAALAGPETIKE